MNPARRSHSGGGTLFDFMTKGNVQIPDGPIVRLTKEGM